jgi:hypothetical protein
MVDETLAQWRTTLGAAAMSSPAAILVDVRDVAGYDYECTSRAQEWLHHAYRLGIQRIAFVASSNVVRTATLLAARSSNVALRAFEHEHAAERWLAGDGH